MIHQANKPIATTPAHVPLARLLHAMSHPVINLCSPTHLPQPTKLPKPQSYSRVLLAPAPPLFFLFSSAYAKSLTAEPDTELPLPFGI